MDRNTPMFGYLTCYLKYTSHDSIYYAKFSTDFCKPLTEEFFSMLLNHVKQIYEQQYGQILTGCFCTKEEYDAHNDKRGQTHITWETDDNEEIKTQIKNLELLKHTDDWIYELGIYAAAIGDIVLNTFDNEQDAIKLYMKIPKAEERKLFLIRKRYRNGKREQEQYQKGDTWHWLPLQSE